MINKKNKLTKVRAGLYEFGNWTISKNEGEFCGPGYEWRAESTGLGEGEFFFSNMKKAVDFVQNKIK